MSEPPPLGDGGRAAPKVSFGLLSSSVGAAVFVAVQLSINSCRRQVNVCVVSDRLTRIVSVADSVFVFFAVVVLLVCIICCHTGRHLDVAAAFG
jgi:hypothetical protein